MPCSQQCSTCNSLADNCTSCFVSNSYLLLGNSKNLCVAECGSGMFGDSLSRTCKSCLPFCLECEAEGMCTKCLTTLILINNKCVSACPDYFYENNSTCSNCVFPCFTCSSANECLSCAKPFHFINSSLFSIGSASNCISQCPLGYYAFSVTSATSQCMLCPSYCFECSDYITCKSCKTGSSRPYLQ